MRKDGFILIEFLVTISIIGIVVALFMPALLGKGCHIRGSAANAEAEARGHAKRLDWDLRGVSCAGADTDLDGYISCTASVQDGDRRVEKSLECASGGPMTVSSGCKVAMPRIEVQR